MVVLLSFGGKKPCSSQLVVVEKISGPQRYHNFLKKKEQHLNHQG